MAFPSNFVWGAAAASYQIEGNTQGVDGCGESVWDMCCKRQGFIKRGDTGFTACDHYNRYPEDVAHMQTLGLQAYRFSTMWPRVLPEGIGKPNPKGLAFYDRLVDKLCAAGITPWCTLFHWDYPLALFNKGGWLNADSPLWFEEYAALVVDLLSDRVTHWFTLNEPACFIGTGMQSGSHAPGMKLPGAQVNCAWHHAMLAHGRAVKVIRERSKSSSPKVGAAPCFGTYIPLTDSPADIAAARKALLSVKTKDMWQARWSLDPAFKGSYPEEGMKLWGAEAPVIKDEDYQYLGLDLDFLGINIYNSTTVKAGPDGGFMEVPYSNDHPHTSFNWPVTPEALYWTTKFLYEEYRKPIIITENGLATNDWLSVDGKCHDPSRIDFLTRYLRGLERAINEGVNLAGYFQWSFIDNFEWAQGYHERFGLIYVDFKTQQRTIKDSGRWYAKVIASNGAILNDGGDAPLC